MKTHLLILPFFLSFLPTFAQTTFDNCIVENLGVYLSDSDTTGTNIREMPGGKIIKVVKNNSSEEEIVMFDVCKMSGNWLLVQTVDFKDKTVGWIHNSVVTTDLNYSNELIKIYKSKSLSAPIIEKCEVCTQIKILEVDKQFSKIEFLNANGEKKQGYILNEKLCGNPYSTCS